jgi:hypothetical protein
VCQEHEGPYLFKSRIRNHREKFSSFQSTYTEFRNASFVIVHPVLVFVVKFGHLNTNQPIFLTKLIDISDNICTCPTGSHILLLKKTLTIN